MKLRYILPLFLLLIKVNAQESTASKQVSTFTIEAPQLKTSRKIWLYLPKNYESSTKKYPVIYMHDAQNLFDAKTSFAGEWNVDEKLDSLSAQVIVVGIENGGDKRLEELTPYKNEKYGGGNAEKYLEFIVNTLKPEIDKKYRTKTDTKNTTIMGSSLGGLVSFSKNEGTCSPFSPTTKLGNKSGSFSLAFGSSKTIRNPFFTISFPVALKVTSAAFPITVVLATKQSS